VSAVNDSNENVSPQTIVDKINYLMEMEKLIKELSDDKVTSPALFKFVKQLHNNVPPCGFSKSNMSRYYAIRTYVPAELWTLMAQTMSLTLAELYKKVLPKVALPDNTDRRHRKWDKNKCSAHNLNNIYDCISKKTRQHAKIFAYR
jgi:hypothetical protein